MILPVHFKFTEPAFFNIWHKILRQCPRIKAIPCHEICDIFLQPVIHFHGKQLAE